MPGIVVSDSICTLAKRYLIIGLAQLVLSITTFPEYTVFDFSPDLNSSRKRISKTHVNHIFDTSWSTFLVEKRREWMQTVGLYKMKAVDRGPICTFSLRLKSYTMHIDITMNIQYTKLI